MEDDDDELDYSEGNTLNDLLSSSLVMTQWVCYRNEKTDIEQYLHHLCSVFKMIMSLSRFVHFVRKVAYKPPDMKKRNPSSCSRCESRVPVWM